MDFRAAVLVKQNSPLKIMKLKTRPLEFGQVLVKIFYSGICRSQLMEIEGKRGQDNYLPHLLGHEATGEVEDIGEGVTKFKKGDKVILTWIKTLGIQSEAPRFKYNTLNINGGSVTTFSEYSVVSENRLVKLPKDIPLDLGVLFGCALQTGAGMVYNELKPKKEDKILVIGLGGIGFSALLALFELGCSEIIAIDVSAEKLEIARSLGIKNCLNGNDPDLINKIKNIYPSGIDSCIESAGKTKTIEMGFRIIKNNGGKLIFASHPPEGEYIRLSPHELISGKKIIGSWGGKSIPDIDIPKLSIFLLKHKSSFYKLLDKRYPLEKINEAIKDLKDGQVLRPLIDMKTK